MLKKITGKDIYLLHLSNRDEVQGAKAAAKKAGFQFLNCFPEHGRDRAVASNVKVGVRTNKDSSYTLGWPERGRPYSIVL